MHSTLTLLDNINVRRISLMIGAFLLFPLFPSSAGLPKMSYTNDSIFYI